MFILGEEKEKETKSSSPQACFVVAQSSGNLMRIVFTIEGGLCFCGGRKTRVHYVCLVLIVRVCR